MNDQEILKTIGFAGAPATSRNLRKNSQSTQRIVSDNTVIIDKPNRGGLEIHVRENTAFEVIDLPVLITESGLSEVVKNDIFIGDNANVVVVAGCGICNDGCLDSTHRGQHHFVLGKNAKLKYIEKHYATGQGGKIIHPESLAELGEGSEMTIETAQLGGVDLSNRSLKAKLAKNAKLIITERIFTEDKQQATTLFKAKLNKPNSSIKISSRSVATGASKQKFVSKITGSTTCFAHVECDAIIKDRAQVRAIPEIDARTGEANLIHEATIGKIAGEQLLKLLTLGYSQNEAEQIIIEGFLK